MKKNILLFEDDKLFCKKIATYFSNFNFKIFLKKTDQKIVDFIKRKKIKMVIISMELDKTYYLCKKIRKIFDLSIIILSNKKNLSLTLKYFEIGVDDYIAKPIRLNEFLAIIKSKFNQEKRWNEESKKSIEVENIVMNKFNKNILINKKKFKVTKTEFKIFSYLINNKNEVLSREEIFSDIWDYKPYGNLNNITVHINNLRKKLRDLNIRNIAIKTIWGFGYKLIINKV